MRKLAFTLLLLCVGAFAQDNRYCSATSHWTGGPTDGPATLPQTCLNTAIVNTPSPGQTITVVPVGGQVTITSLLATYATAQCGDTIVIPHPATIPVVNDGMIFGPKGCDDAHWITIKSDGTLPIEGARVDPSFWPQMFRFTLKANTEVHITGDHLRFIGVEAVPAGTIPSVNFFAIQGGNHIIFDRVYLHGVAGQESRRGINIAGGTYIGVVESYLSDFHCIAISGSCSDSQAILGADSTLAENTITIKNNYLEAAAENILFGGATSGLVVPSDIEIRRNTMTKPMNWNPSDPSFIGPQKYIVKNLFELKNAQRVLFEGNTLTNSWGGFSQNGWGSVFTPRGTWGAVQDITYRNNTVQHVGAGFQIAASKSSSNGGDVPDSLGLQRFSMHDVYVDDIDMVHYNGNGTSFQLSSGEAVSPPLNNVTIDHVTVNTDPAHTLLSVGANPLNPVKPHDIHITNSVLGAGKFSVWSIGGPYGVCAKANHPDTTMSTCWDNSTFTGNTVIGGTNFTWPAGNTIVEGSRLSAIQAAKQ